MDGMDVELDSMTLEMNRMDVELIDTMTNADDIFGVWT